MPIASCGFDGLFAKRPNFKLCAGFLRPRWEFGCDQGHHRADPFRNAGMMSAYRIKVV
jgi:hypothetical protein